MEIHFIENILILQSMKKYLNLIHNMLSSGKLKILKREIFFKSAIKYYFYLICHNSSEVEKLYLNLI